MLERFKDSLYGGIDPNIPGDGGPACASFLSYEKRFIETIIFGMIAIFYLIWGFKNASVPENYKSTRKDRAGKRVLLVVMSLAFGIEIGFKCSTKTVIYLLNPCHVTTLIQIYLLAAAPSKFVTILFRLHLNLLAGAVLAIIFPVTNTRLLPFEYEIYWIQHGMMLVVPYYLLRLGGVYVVEPLKNYGWSVMAVGFIFLYHFLILQPVGMIAEVNLNNMLCPAISDPFYGPNYRIYACLHQSIVIPAITKLYTVFAHFFLIDFGPTRIKSSLDADVNLTSYLTCIEKMISTNTEGQGESHPEDNKFCSNLFDQMGCSCPEGEPIKLVRKKAKD